MPFLVKLLVRELNLETASHLNTGACSEDILQSDSDLSMLTEICRMLARNDVRFQIAGFFAQNLPLETGTDLPYFLEDLPGLINFVHGVSTEEYSVSLWGQGIETHLIFTKEGEQIEVKALSCIKRDVYAQIERISNANLTQQLSDFVEKYEEAIVRYLPQCTKMDWNQRLLSAVKGLHSSPVNGL
jgi:hypothetical protein